jgi:hypothetical protein
MSNLISYRVELIDLVQSQNGQKTIGSALFDFAKDYFEQEAKAGRHVHPIYLQHEGFYPLQQQWPTFTNISINNLYKYLIKGHSRTIVGVESGKVDSLLIFDPSTRKNTIEQNRQNKVRLLNLFRKNVNIFNKKKEYQLLVVKGAISSNEEYQVNWCLLREA